MKGKTNTRCILKRIPSRRNVVAGVWAGIEVLEGRTLLTTPVVLAVSPAPAASGIAASAKISVRFNTPMDRASLNASTFQVQDASGALLPGRISYNDVNQTATFDAAVPLAYSASYTATVQGGGGGVKDIVGDTLPSSYRWSFITTPPPEAGPGGPILILTGAADPFSSYYAEILRSEGFNEFATSDLSNLSAQSLASYDLVILGSLPLSGDQLTILSDWVGDGGNLIAMRPDKQLSGLLGLSEVPGTLSNAYLLIDTASGPGAGLVDQTLQFHGSADIYTLDGATPLATLYSDANTATSFPAVTWRQVGSGRAAAFTYDLARSIVYSRQGNPAWAGRDRDGNGVIRSDDLFYGPASFDPQPSWIDFSRIAIPQADEQQRLLGNLITQLEQQKMPLPHFWYLPDGAKAAVVMTGDDHGNAGTIGRFNSYSALGPVASTPDWQTVRATSYMYPGTIASDAQAAAFAAAGFELALHVSTNVANWTPAQLRDFYASQLAQFNSLYPSLPTPATNRTHAITWSDYATQPAVEYDNRIRLDANYYYYPAAWVNDRPGLFTGSGLPMRFADAQGRLIDVYQATTQMTDESGQSYPYTINTLLDAALGSQGYYGVFTVNAHTDTDVSAVSDAVITSALSRGVPVISSRQLLDWLDGRNSSSFNSLSWDAAAHTLSFTVTAGQGASGLRALLPAADSTGLRLASITCNSAAVPFTRERVKGIEYAIFPAAGGAYSVSYASDAMPPTISSVNVAPAGQTATLTWTTDEPADSRILYGTSPTELNLSVTDPAMVNAHSVVLTGLLPNTLYYYRILATDSSANTASSPASELDPLRFNSAVFTASLWSGSTQPAIASTNDSTAIEAGVKFRSDMAGYITALRFYKGPGNTGTHSGHLWASDGTLLGTASFSSETASGWQQASFDTPIAISANTTYIASYFAPFGHYASNTGYFASSGADTAPLHALANGVDGSNGVFNYGGSGFPASSYNAANYWVDVVFTDASAFQPQLLLINGTALKDRIELTSDAQNFFYRINSDPAVTVPRSLVSAIRIDAQGGDELSFDLDLQATDLLVQSDPASCDQLLKSISQAIASKSLRTSQADGLHGLAAILNQDSQGKRLYDTFAGTSADESSILVKLTWNGDADLNGILDGSDYFLVDKGFLSRTSANPPTGYGNGDFNYDGTIDGSDYFLIDKAFLSQRAHVPSAPLAAAAAPAASVFIAKPIATARKVAQLKLLRQHRHRVLPEAPRSGAASGRP